ncbi:MAG TPA: EthD family reductase [Anaerolineales bacterium]|nr:EthD family reductase [Anaerolineales bacterium]
MYKMVILFEQPINDGSFQENWQIFMGMAEKMPRLRREVVSRIDKVVYSRDGKQYDRMHELIFDSRDALETALQSQSGIASGKFLQDFTQGRITILTAEHLEAEEKDFNKEP